MLSGTTWSTLKLSGCGATSPGSMGRPQRWHTPPSAFILAASLR